MVTAFAEHGCANRLPITAHKASTTKSNLSLAIYQL